MNVPQLSHTIETSKLTKHFRQNLNLIKAVENITLRINPGEIFGILGPNGSGKTTLIKMLCTLIIPTSGSARIAGFDTIRDPQEVKSLIGLVTGQSMPIVGSDQWMP